jgi:2,3-diaminopropionate biosynthesis protein SbnA
MRYRSVLETVHETPLVGLPALSARCDRELYMKLESMNPGGSMKDRIALFGIREAERRGTLRRGGTIVESTSGSLGTSLALIGPRLGYRVICVVDPKTTGVNTRLMAAYGARVECVETPDTNGNYLAARLKRVEDLLAALPDAWWFNQYANTDNPRAHVCHTGPEIRRDMDGDLQWLVCPVGTGGLAAGLARYMRANVPGCRIMAVDAEGSVVLKGAAGPRRQVGIGSNRPSDHLDFDLLDELIYVTDDEAFAAAVMLARDESLCLGCSSGSALAGFLKRLTVTAPGDRVVIIAADHGMKYLDTVYDPAWRGDRTRVPAPLSAASDADAYTWATSDRP